MFNSCINMVHKNYGFNWFNLYCATMSQAYQSEDSQTVHHTHGSLFMSSPMLLNYTV